MPHLTTLFDQSVAGGKFIGSVQDLSQKNGASTDALFLVKNAHGNPVFIVKGISPENKKELENLDKLSRMSILRHLPTDPRYPILSWPEKIFQIKREGRADYQVAILNVAGGEQLNKLVDKGISDAAYMSNEVVSAFFSTGQALALFNLYCAKLDQSATLVELEKKLQLAHQDLHWGNIFIRQKTLHGADGKALDLKNLNRVYLIDIETMANMGKESLAYDPSLGRARLITSQLLNFYAVPLFCWGHIFDLSTEQIGALFGLGFIRGYASQFSGHENKMEAAIILLNEMIVITERVMYLVAVAQKHSTVSDAETAMKSYFRDPNLNVDELSTYNGVRKFILKKKGQGRLGELDEKGQALLKKLKELQKKFLKQLTK